MTIASLTVLVGHWDIAGRSLGEDRDNIAGRVEIEPVLRGGVLQLVGILRAGEIEVESLELVWADPSTGAFSAHVYSGDGPPLSYRWERDGQTLIHSGGGATYRGTISDDGATITGAWRPDPGQPVHPGSAYDATMRRITDESADRERP